MYDMQAAGHSGISNGNITCVGGTVWRTCLKITIGCIIRPLAYFFKAVHSLLENKKFRHHPHTMGYVYANFLISTICGF